MSNNALSILGWAITGMAFAAIPLEGRADGLSLYRDFVSQPRFFTNLTFAQSGNLFGSYVEGQPPRFPEGFVLFRAAAQSNSWYLQIASNAPVGPNDPGMGNGYTVGKSYKDYWGLSADLKTVSRTATSAKPKSSPRVLSERGLDRINMIRRLGLVYLEPLQIPAIPETISWVDGSNFVGNLGSKGTMTGKVLSLIDSFPECVRLQFTGRPGADFLVIYDYKPQRALPPARITGSKVMSGKTNKLWEFVIHEAGLGEIATPFEGYDPDQFMTPSKLRSVEVITVDGDDDCFNTLESVEGSVGMESVP